LMCWTRCRSCWLRRWRVGDRVRPGDERQVVAARAARDDAAAAARRDTCTRLPILLKLRHTKEAQLPVLVVRDSATGKEEVRRTVSLAGGQVDVRHEMERVLAAEQGGLTSVSMTRTIEVHSPAVPSIDLVDLPGLRLSAGSDAADMPEKAKALVKAQVEQHKGSAIFLVSCTASTPPSQSLGLQLVEELGLQRDTIGVVTMCDNIGKLDMKKLPDRLRQTSGDAFQLAPHGFIGTMTEPIKDEGLSNVRRLEMMATAERKWFASQPLLSPLLTDCLLTCDALVDKLSSVYTQYLRSTWAPLTLIRLNGELKRLQAKCDALGLPEAVEAPTGPALDELRAAACRAAEAVLDEAMGGVADECFDSIIKPTVSKLVKPGSGTGLATMHLAMVKGAMESHRRFVSQAKQAFAAVTSSFKLQRFPAFTEAIVAKLRTQASHERGTFVWREQSTAELVLEAANEVTDWKEACAAERVVIRKQMLQVEPVKAKTLEVLGVASESVLTTEEVERAVADADPAAALVALLQACAIGARTPVASGIASLADAPPDQSTDLMRGALAAAGALPPLVAMLGDGTAEERAAAAEALRKLARNDANKAAIAAAGAIEPLVALVRDGDARGKAEAAGALWSLAYGDVAIVSAIAAAGAIEPLVALVRDGDREGKAIAAAALWTLADGDVAIVSAIAAADAIEPLVALVRDGDAQGKANAAAALWNLAVGDNAMKAAIAAAGAIEPLVALVRDGDAQGKAKAAGALWNLAVRDNAMKAAIAAAGAIEPLVALVRDGDREGKAIAAAALRNLAGGDDAFKAAIAAAGAIEPLSALVRDGDAQGKAKAAGALRNLAGGGASFKAAIAAAGGGGLVFGLGAPAIPAAAPTLNHDAAVEEEEPFTKEEVQQLYDDARQALSETVDGEDLEGQYAELGSSNLAAKLTNLECRAECVAECMPDGLAHQVRLVAPIAIDCHSWPLMVSFIRYAELDAGLAGRDVQERGRVLVDVLEYLRNPQEATEEGEEEEEGDAQNGADDLDPGNYLGPDALRQLLQQVQSLCVEEDLIRCR
jgi:vacuolar protein 8